MTATMDTDYRSSLSPLLVAVVGVDAQVKWLEGDEDEVDC